MKGEYCVSFNEGGYLRKNFSDRIEIYCAFQLRTKNTTNNDYYFTIKSDSYFVLNLSYRDGYFWYVYGSDSDNYFIGSKYISSNTNYFIQVYYKHHNTDGRVFVKINGVIDVDKIVRTAYEYASFDNIRFGDNSYIDNIVIDDSVMPEETEIVVLRPNGVGAYSDFVSTPSGNNYSCVDEIPYDDSDYVTSSGVNAVDTYLLENLSPHAKSIKCVQLQARVRKDSDSLLTNFNFAVGHNSINYYSNDIALTNTFSDYSNIFVGPTGSGIWYPFDVNLTEIGIRART